MNMICSECGHRVDVRMLCCNPPVTEYKCSGCGLTKSESHKEVDRVVQMKEDD